ncbi:MAG: alpha/beta hydrolase, partial [Opitutales bacterium]
MKYLTNLLTLILFASASVLSAADPITWNLWPGEAPGEIVTLPPESYRVTDNRQTAGKPVSRLQNVSVPTLTIYKPDPKIDTGSSIMIAPGGGFTILAFDKEGTEVAEWANTIGMTAIVLKYRVPGNVHNPDKPWLPAAQDGQRAMSLVRSRSDELGIDPDRIGIMGFSAGGAPVMYTAMVSERLYESVDRHDDHNFRPAFAAPIYSGWWMP